MAHGKDGYTVLKDCPVIVSVTCRAVATTVCMHSLRVSVCTHVLDEAPPTCYRLMKKVVSH